MTCKGEVEGSDYCGFRTNSGVGVVFGGVDCVSLEKSVCRNHFRSWCHLPDNVKVLQE